MKYRYEGQEQLLYFPNPQAMLPVRRRDGGLGLVAWGRRREEKGVLPQGGWARIESVNQGVWDKYEAQPVKIIVDQFMEKDASGVSHWFELEADQWIQGLLARSGGESRIYVVTTTPPMEMAIHERWPRIMAK